MKGRTGEGLPRRRNSAARQDLGCKSPLAVIFPSTQCRILLLTLIWRVPILALVDGDAFGIDILSVYKYGSMCMQHEKEQLAAERVQWLGLWSSELSA